MSKTGRALSRIPREYREFAQSLARVIIRGRTLADDAIEVALTEFLGNAPSAASKCEALRILSDPAVTAYIDATEQHLPRRTPRDGRTP